MPESRDEFFKRMRETPNRPNPARAAHPSGPTGVAAMVCPHCQTRGTVRTKQVKVKQGISGGKATGAVLTGGLSMLATGLSRKQLVTEAKCLQCGAVWHF